MYSWVARKVGLEHCRWSVTMDTIVPEAGTAELLPLQGRVGVVYLDMDTLGVVVVVLLVLGHILPEGECRGRL